MAKDRNEQPDKQNNADRLNSELTRGFSNLWGACGGAPGGAVYALYLRRKQGGIWVAVAKKSTPDDPAAFVAFGGGGSIGAALADLNASISQGRWKRDIPWGRSG